MRKTLVAISLVLVVFVWLRPHRAESVGPSFVFPLSLSGAARQTDLGFGPGTKITPAKIDDKVMAALLRGEEPGAFPVPFLDVAHADPSGRFFVYFDGRNPDGSTSWRFATNSTGTMATTLQGSITQDGFFWLAGTYDLPTVGSASVFMQGQVKFAKGTFNPTKISGICNFVSAALGEGFTVKFKTVGKPLA